MTTNTSHKDCSHPATSASRRMCRDFHTLKGYAEAAGCDVQDTNHDFQFRVSSRDSYTAIIVTGGKLGGSVLITLTRLFGDSERLPRKNHDRAFRIWCSTLASS